LWNDIGTGVIDGVLNDIYQSIVIGNKSYQNAIIRDMISVGNNIMNDINNASPVLVNSFLSQKPIVIGNNITEEYLDFHVNIGNVFLKTNNNIPQIYLGKSGEVVGIGYTSNVLLKNTYALHVNGDASMNTVDMNGSTKTFPSRLYIQPHSLVSMSDEYPYVNVSTTSDTCIVGVCKSCSSSNGIFNTQVQYDGFIDIAVLPPFTRGDLITSCNVSGDVAFGIAQPNNIVSSYTIAKALKTSDINSVSPQITPCVLML